MDKPTYLIKGHWQGLLGRTIEAVVVSTNDAHSPRKVIHLVFADGTYFEIYSGVGDMAGLKRVYQGELFDVLHCVREHSEVVVHHVDESVISYDHALRIASRYLEDPPHRGCEISDLQLWEDIGRKPNVYGKTEEWWQRQWVVYLARPATGPRESLIMAIHQTTGEITYVGPAGDEG